MYIEDRHEKITAWKIRCPGLGGAGRVSCRGTESSINPGTLPLRGAAAGRRRAQPQRSHLFSFSCDRAHINQPRCHCRRFSRDAWDVSSWQQQSQDSPRVGKKESFGDLNALVARVSVTFLAISRSISLARRAAGDGADRSSTIVSRVFWWRNNAAALLPVCRGTPAHLCFAPSCLWMPS